MTPKQRKQLGKYARMLADKMELRDWTVCIAHDSPGNDNHIASVAVTFGRKRCTIYFAADFWTTTPEEQRQTVCHELVHCLLKPMEFNLNNTEQLIGTSAFHILSEAHRDLAEYAVDAMADAVAKHLPLPTWATKPK